MPSFWRLPSLVWPCAQVGGAMLSGVREAVRALCTLAGDGEEAASAAAQQVDTDSASRRRLCAQCSPGDRFDQGCFVPCVSAFLGVLRLASPLQMRHAHPWLLGHGEGILA